MIMILNTNFIGIPVALLQEDGKFSNNSYLIRKDLSRPLKDFTLCVRLSLNYLRGEKNYWLSIGNATKDNLLTGGKKYHLNTYLYRLFLFLYIYYKHCIPFQVFDNGEKGPRILLQKIPPDVKGVEDEISIDFDRFDFQAWHHYCFIFSTSAQFPYPGGYVNLTNKAYMDGNLVNTGRNKKVQCKLTASAL